MASRKSLLFSLTVAIFVWLGWFVLAGGAEAFVTLLANWKISLTMVFGSFIAGATSEGGGAVAFPVFTKLLYIPPMDAKVFSLAIQSVGMTAASMVIVFMGIKVEWRVIRWASLGGVPGMLFGAMVLAPSLPPPLVKMSFTVMVTSFAVTLFILNRDIPLRHNKLDRHGHREIIMLLMAGFIGGTMSGLVGNGIDIITFSLMVLLFRISEKIATPTSVVLMAINAVVGFAMHVFYIGGFTETVRDYWIAAIPIVVVGAPVGAMVCSMLDRHTIAHALITLIFVELVSSLLIIPMTTPVVTVSIAMLVIFAGIYYWMYKVQTYVPAKLD